MKIYKAYSPDNIIQVDLMHNKEIDDLYSKELDNYIKQIWEY